MSDEEERFLSRWSRRKSEAPDEDARESGPPPDPSESHSETEGDPEVIARLPDIESLTESSDFSAFMAEGVPEVLRRRALRRLWRLNPVFANLDGLNDYDEDFTDAATVIEGLKTAYKVGRGMVGDEPEPAPESEVAAEEEAGGESEAVSDALPEESPVAPVETVTAAKPDEPDATPATGEPAPAVAPRGTPLPAAARPGDSGRSALRRRWGDSNA